MSFWYDLKQKAYSTDKNNSWLKAYVDRITALFKKETADTFETHFSGDKNRHLAKDIDTDGGNTVEEAFEIERTKRQVADESNSNKIAQEATDRIAADSELSKLISNETAERLSADSALTASLSAESVARKAAEAEINTQIAQLFSASSIKVPTLAEACPDGTPIGNNAWTGTGFFCKSTGDRYSANTEITSVSGFNRFCLRPIDIIPYWKNWTPYFDYEGQAYEFFYSEVRGVYETLIPATTLTADEVVSAIRWEYHAPTLINYGKITNLLGYLVKSDSTELINVKSEFFFRNSSGFINKDDFDMTNSYVNNYCTLSSNSIAIADMDWVRGTIYVLTLDTGACGQPKSSTSLIQVNKACNQLTNMVIETCDKF